MADNELLVIKKAKELCKHTLIVTRRQINFIRNMVPGKIMRCTETVLNYAKEWISLWRNR